MPKSRFLIALGSNQRHIHYGLPHAVLTAAIAALEADAATTVLSQSSIVSSRPIGPSNRRYANAAILIETRHDPISLLSMLKSIESTFGPRRGERWSRRVLDLDIILWSKGYFSSRNPALIIPHVEMQHRPFVLRPAAEITPDWSDPVTGLTIRQLAYRIGQT
ncbi:MAG: 2-amino-4-hydroxy-6-hydroxymethyldihydropteridine diphosphokinase [Parasphingorhabdus sp.]|uniref:2-amino-4-hydroxy-6- hydroxymethyldihydropteridine diphosphokinase n=1 Tax=Parasphingorhabdus sp. TaxID=2709688 RepID=UPI00329A7151